MFSSDTDLPYGPLNLSLKKMPLTEWTRIPKTQYIQVWLKQEKNTHELMPPIRGLHYASANAICGVKHGNTCMFTVHSDVRTQASSLDLV